MTDSSAAIVEGFTLQADWCHRMHSPLYGALLTIARDDIVDGGVVDDVVSGFDGDPVAAALALRFMGGLHRLVLMGLAPELARHYPSVGGTPVYAELEDDLAATVTAHRGFLRDALSIAPQTNEVGRSALLFPGLLEVLGGESWEVRLLEIGASGGLNLFGDRFRYDYEAWSWGEQNSPVQITGSWNGRPPPIGGEPRVVQRRGCDVMPLDVADEELQLRLLSFIWPDQPERFERVRGAIAIALDDPPSLDRADAGEWLEQELGSTASRGTLTAVQHSLMWQYLSDETKSRAIAAIERAADAATKMRPFAHIAFEPAPDWNDGGGFLVTVTRWPGGEGRIVGRAHAHGTWVEWGSG